MPTADSIRRTLESITIGFTRVRWGVVVTRWSARQFELGSFGREAVDIDIAVDRLRAMVDRSWLPALEEV